MFRTGVVKRPQNKAAERVIPATAKDTGTAKNQSKSTKDDNSDNKGAAKAHPRSKDKRKRRDR
jgi:hypothetical protein